MAAIHQQTQQKPRAWARVWAAIRPPHSRNLRAGAWYPVLRDELEDRVTLDLSGAAVDVPRRLLEIRRHRPEHFTIVHKVGDTFERCTGKQDDLGRRYAVCPSCAGRFPLFGEPVEKDCPSCGHSGEIGWWE